MHISEHVSEDNNYFHFLFIWPCHELAIILYFVSSSYVCRRTTETIPSTTFVTVSACLRWCTVWFTCVSFGIIWQGRSWESYWLQQCVTIWTTLAITIRTYDKTIHHFHGKLFITRLKYTQERDAFSQPDAMQNSLVSQSVNILPHLKLILPVFLPKPHH